jgi:hypothetical protein
LTVPTPPIKHLIFDSCAGYGLFTNSCNNVDGQHHILQLHLKRNHTTRKLPKDDTETVDITLGVVCICRVLHALRSYIGHNTKESCFSGVDGLVDRLAQTEIGNQRLSVGVDKDIS